MVKRKKLEISDLRIFSSARMDLSKLPASIHGLWKGLIIRRALKKISPIYVLPVSFSS